MENNIGERIYQIRKKELKLTLDQFGEKIGIKKAALSMIESGKANATDRLINDICREFNVNIEYLKNGIEPIFLESDDDVINDLKKEYGLSEITVSMLRAYIKCSPEVREQFEQMLQNEIDSMNIKKDGS